MLVARAQTPRSADVIVVAVDAGSAGVLEAADLVQTGVATRVAIFPDPEDERAEREYARRGVPFEDSAAIRARQLRSLGVDAIEVIPRAVAGSDQEGRVLAAWSDQREFHSVVVVTATDHSRRLRHILRRSTRPGQTITVVVARYSSFDPDRWWETRSGIRTEIVELEKLLLELARHPFS